MLHDHSNYLKEHEYFLSVSTLFAMVPKIDEFSATITIYALKKETITLDETLNTMYPQDLMAAVSVFYRHVF